MIDKFNITLKSPTCKFNDLNLLNNEEVECLLESIKEFFNQRNIIYDAELTVSNNEWEAKPEYPGAKFRKDATFNLSDLKHIEINADNILFKVGCFEKTYKIKVTDDFFFFFNWERAYYD